MRSMFWVTIWYVYHKAASGDWVTQSSAFSFYHRDNLRFLPELNNKNEYWGSQNFLHFYLGKPPKKFFFHNPPPVELSGHRNFFIIILVIAEHRIWQVWKALVGHSKNTFFCGFPYLCPCVRAVEGWGGVSYQHVSYQHCLSMIIIKPSNKIWHFF